MSSSNIATSSGATINVITDDTNQGRVWTVGTAPQAFVADLINRPAIPLVVQYPDGTLDECSAPVSIGVLRGFFPVVDNAVVDACENNYSIAKVIIPLPCSAAAHDLTKILKYANRIVVEENGKVGPYGPVYQKPFSTYSGIAQVALALGMSALVAEMIGRIKAILYTTAGGKSGHSKPQIEDLKIVYSMGLPKSHWVRVGIETSIAASMLDGKLINKDEINKYLEENRGIARRVRDIQAKVKG